MREVSTFRTDPLASRYEVNFHLPNESAPGAHVLQVNLGTRTLAQLAIEVA